MYKQIYIERNKCVYIEDYKCCLLKNVMNIYRVCENVNAYVEECNDECNVI